MKQRHKIALSLLTAAALTVLFAIAGLAGERLVTPQPDNVASQNQQESKPTSDPSEPNGQSAATPIPAAEADENAEPLATPLPEEVPADTDDSRLKDTVWYTPTGRYFHADPNCSGMENAVSSDISGIRAAGLGINPCPACLPDFDTLYFADDGTFLHRALDCALLSQRSYIACISDAGGWLQTDALPEYRFCPLCILPELSVYSAPDGTILHLQADCASVQLADAHPIIFSEDDALPCPICTRGRITAETLAIGRALENAAAAADWEMPEIPVKSTPEPVYDAVSEEFVPEESDTTP